MTNGNGRDPAAEAAGAADQNIRSVFEEDEEEFIIPTEEEEEEVVATAPSPASQSHGQEGDASEAAGVADASGSKRKEWTGVLPDGGGDGDNPEGDVDAQLEALQTRVGGTVVPIGGNGPKAEGDPDAEAAQANGAAPSDAPQKDDREEDDSTDEVNVLGRAGEDDSLAETVSVDDPLETSSEAPTEETAKAEGRRPARSVWQRAMVFTVGGALIAALGYWQWPYRSPASDTTVAVTPAPAPALPPAGSVAPSFPPAATLAPQPEAQAPPTSLEQRVERIAGDLDTLNRGGGLLGPGGGAPVMEETAVGSTPSDSGISAAQWEEVRATLERMEQRMALIEQEQRALTDAAKTVFETPRPVLDWSGAPGSAEKPRAAPLRARLADCKDDALAFVEQLGPVRMAAHEGVDGRRWVRILSEAWRSDVASGDRLPVGGPGEARVWVDQAGVFGVVEMPGHGPCRVTWDDEETPQ